VVVRDFDIVGIAVLPSEADPVLVIYLDAVLTYPVTAQPL
jgi:hypothetical protein